MTKNVILATTILVSIIGFFTGITSGEYVMMLGSIILFIVVMYLVNQDFKQLNKRRDQIENELASQLEDCSLDITSYSSMTIPLNETVHPLNGINAIDYELSLQSHFLEGIVEGTHFLYHEEILYSPKQIPVKNMFCGGVIEFKTTDELQETLVRNHKLLKELSTVSYLYTNNHKIVFYIPRATYIENALETEKYQEEIDLMVYMIKQLTTIFKKLEIILKEEQK